ncbi:MAG: DUF393 domain-containing protein [Thiohalocapsa sp.]
MRCGERRQRSRSRIHQERRFRIGAATWQMTSVGQSRWDMEVKWGRGGYTVMRGRATAAGIESVATDVGQPVERPTKLTTASPITNPRPVHNNESTLMFQLTTFYDGGCPLCSKEIAHYQRVDRAGRIRWIDLTTDAEALSAAGFDAETAMRRLHVRDVEGQLISGVPAFVAVWQQLPGYRLLAWVVTALRLSGPLDRTYARFADWRFERRCRDGACALERH